MSTQKILVADDDPQFLKAIAVRLRSAGYDVTVARDSYQAVQFASEDPPDVIVLDIYMPAGDGFTVQERLQKMSRLAMIPIIFVTGEKSDRVREQAERLGGFKLIYKPIDTDDLLSAVADAIEPEHITHRKSA